MGRGHAHRQPYGLQIYQNGQRKVDTGPRATVAARGPQPARHGMGCAQTLGVGLGRSIAGDVLPDWQTPHPRQTLRIHQRQRRDLPACAAFYRRDYTATGPNPREKTSHGYQTSDKRLHGRIHGSRTKTDRAIKQRPEASRSARQTCRIQLRKIAKLLPCPFVIAAHAAVCQELVHVGPRYQR